jgi:methylmalonyl-CoA/ethylmalonyl-CoA epimerase
MILRIDHVALAVRDYEKAFDFFTTLFNAVPGANADDPSMRYLWQTLSLGDLSRFELVTPTGPGSFLDGFLKDREGGVHHITMQTPDIHQAKKTLEEKGIPYFGFKDYGPLWRELFIHPRDAFGVLIQIAQFEPDDWLPPQVKMPMGKRWSVEREGSGLSLTMRHPGGGKVKFGLTREEAAVLMDDLKKAL